VLVKAWLAHENGRQLIGTVPPGWTVEVYPGEDAELPSDPATVEFWNAPFLATSKVVALAGQMPALRVIQLMSAGVDTWVGRVPETVTLCDARGVHDSSTAEWAAAAALAHVRNFPAFARAQAVARWTQAPTDELAGKRVLIVGAGSIGSALAARLAPFDVEITLVARSERDGVHGVERLPALLPDADVTVLLVPLTPHTRGLVDAKFLAALPDGALLVNAARGPVVDTAALLAECASGRLRAALDVTDPEPLPAGHQLWTLPNVFITPHVAGSVPGLHRRAFGLVGDQLRRYAAREPLINVVTGDY
jgi:phosphoglycerate dehydrogenase-like enzyme